MERAAANTIHEGGVDEFYRKRSILQRSVLSDYMAGAVSFFASDPSAKSTGNIFFNVDGRNLAAFTR